MNKHITVSFFKVILSLGLFTFFESRSLADDFSSANDIDKSIEELLETKISSAAKYDQTTSEAAASVTIVTSEDIRRYGYKNLRDMLRSQRSFYSTDDRNYIYMGLRGFSRPGSYNNQIVLMMNGHVMNEKVFGSPFFGYDFALNPEAIERIEIVRGPGSTLYGSAATFAVINVITKGGKEVYGANAFASYGSFGLQKYGVSAGKEFDDGFSASLSALYGESKGADQYYKEFDTLGQDGIARGLDWEKYWGAQAALAYKGISAQAFISTRQKAVPTAAWGTLFNTKPFDMRDTRAFAELKYEFSPIDNIQTVFKAGYDLYLYGGKYPYAGESELQPIAIQRDSALAESYSLEGQMIWDVSPKNRLTFGLEAERSVSSDYYLWWESDSSFTIDVNHPNSIYSVYAQDQHQFTEDFGITLGMRYDQYSLVNISNVSARAAFVYNAWENGVIKLLYNNAFRTPNVYELYYEDDYGAMPNPDLKPEIINMLEGLIEYKFNKNLWGMASIFGYKYNDLIDQVVVNDSLSQFRNISAVDAFGFEFELKATPLKGLSGYASISVQSAVNAENSKKLTNSPTFITNLGATHSINDLLRFSAEFYYESGRYAPSGIETDPVFLGNAFISLVSDEGGDALHQIFRRFNLTLKIENIFDVEYYHPANIEHVQQTIRQNGRTFELQGIVRI